MQFWEQVMMKLWQTQVFRWLVMLDGHNVQIVLKWLYNAIYNMGPYIMRFTRYCRSLRAPF